MDRTGTTVAGKYRLSRLIGSGSMGAVYAAVHQFTGKHCAIKLIDASLAENEGFSARFLREARSAAEIGHPTICDVMDAGQDPDGSLYIALELLEGRTLDEAIEADDLRVEEIVEIGTQLCDGLAAAHASGLVHRDIKPENIFLVWDEHGDLHVKILDFGVAKRTKGHGQELVTTQQGAVFGTPYYMAPEQAAGDPVDDRADIWGAGAVLFHALTGRPPFDEDTYNKLITKLMTEEPPRLAEFCPEAPEYLRTAVDGALQRDADVRWQSARTMAEALRLRGSGEIGLDWEVHEDHTVRMEGRYDATEDVAPALAALSSASNELPNIEVDAEYLSASQEFPQFDGGGGPTLRSDLPPAMVMEPTPPPASSNRGILVGLMLGIGIATVGALLIGLVLFGLLG
ncbi:MAG: serine/threonine-protein kinase [Sandaracinaceae bacterium]